MELWPVLALGFSFCGAVIVGFNHWANLDGTRLLVLRWLGVAPLALLAWVFLPWPGRWEFYAAAAGMGVMLALSDKLLFNAAARHGGRLAALYIPMKMLLGFGLWAAFVPGSVSGLAAAPWRGVLVLVGFLLCSGALLLLRRQDGNRAAVLAVVPVAIILAFGDVVAKYALDSQAAGMAAVVGGAAAFLAVTNTVGSVLGLVELRHKGALVLPTAREVWVSAVFGVILMLSLCLLLVTLAIAPNPGYVGAITMLSALWLAIHGYWHHGERSNWWDGVVLLAGAVCVAVGAA